MNRLGFVCALKNSRHTYEETPKLHVFAKPTMPLRVEFETVTGDYPLC